MANVNRYVGGSKSVVPINVLSAVTVELGDLMFIDNADNLRNNGSSTASQNGYPIEYLRISGSSLELNKAALKSCFIGVAMDDKDGISGGADLNISVAVSGIFNFDLKPAKSVKVVQMFGASGTTAASDLFNQKIMKTDDSDMALGYFTETKNHAQDANVFIRTIFNGVIS